MYQPHCTAPYSRLTILVPRGEGEGGRGTTLASETYLTDSVFFLVFCRCPSIPEVRYVQSECIAFASAHHVLHSSSILPLIQPHPYLLYLSPQSIWFPFFFLLCHSPLSIKKTKKNSRSRSLLFNQALRTGRFSSIRPM